MSGTIEQMVEGKRRARRIEKSRAELCTGCLNPLTKIVRMGKGSMPDLRIESGDAHVCTTAECMRFVDLSQCPSWHAE